MRSPVTGVGEGATRILPRLYCASEGTRCHEYLRVLHSTFFHREMGLLPKRRTAARTGPIVPCRVDGAASTRGFPGNRARWIQCRSRHSPAVEESTSRVPV